MTQENNRRYRSEKQPPNKKKGDRILNYLITLVVILIVVVAAFIFTDEGKKKATTEAPKETVKEQATEKPKTEEHTKEKAVSEQKSKEDAKEPLGNPKITSVEDLKQSDSAKVAVVNDGVVKESIEDPNWKPYETKQQESGTTHVSSYDKGSVDWQEKITAISSITGLSEQDMTIWFIKNNGGTDRSIGTVSSKDQTKKYRVSLVWIEKQGWKPEKVEVLQQLEGAY
ncbi:MAG: YrrS family protein [Kurthia sp.]|nr:YrrS family protein [Candidatus Kurthia equi]